MHTELYSSAGKKIILENLSSILSQRKDKQNFVEKENFSAQEIKHPKWLNFFKGVFDDNAKNVDFILLIVIIDIYTSSHYSFYIYLLISLKILIRFILSLFYGVRTKWAESFVNDLKIDNDSKRND